MSPEDIERELGSRQQPDAFEVWPENWCVALAWLALSSQWRLHRPPLGGKPFFEGMRFESLPVAVDIGGVRGKKQRRRALVELALMEQHALPILNGVDDYLEEDEEAT